MATRRTPGPPKAGNIRAGMGGWTFAPWRDNFYPGDLIQREELSWASRQVTSIEINGTYYRAQSQATYERWASETPPGFVFSVKAPRRIVQTRALDDTGEQVTRFLQGLTALGDRLGPVLWQFMPTRTFDPDTLRRFFDLLPDAINGLALRHAIEVRHDSFLCDEYLALARTRGVATVFTDSPDYPSLADLTGPFVYARLMRSVASRKTGYTAPDLKRWADRAKAWAAGKDPADLPHVSDAAPSHGPRDVFVYFISAAKERNPAAAMAFLQQPGIAHTA
ncbi:uncharacterized protein YecE (DUF72 family) [Luteibacter sp. Sphag1AF]|uniref:DUF72 domain-containing protein n=1 Tax=Luteibacter sp. Sphag1AF TaxID=2587031 RepID=UPI00161E47AB|nr:DUF72 domain-containing protein [Luteibacter sp. Sphag1AF]MBB3226742.1 uncharacterized protein YecE (DUF72 family) [Luteibacter sp. Sphag1AF]